MVTQLRPVRLLAKGKLSVILQLHIPLNSNMLTPSEQNQLSQTSSDVRDIKIAIMGNPEFGTRGITHEIRDIKKEQALQQMQIDANHKTLNDRVEKIEKSDYKKGVVIATASAGVGAVTGATGMALLKTWLTKVFTFTSLFK